MKLSNSVFAKSNHQGPKIYIPWLLLCTAAIPLGHVISPKLPAEEVISPCRCCRPAVRNRMHCAGDLFYVHNSSICKTEVQGFSETTIILTKQYAVIWRKTTLTRDNERVVHALSFAFECYRRRIVGFYAAVLSSKLTETGLINIPYKSFRVVTDCKTIHKRNPSNLTISSSRDI